MELFKFGSVNIFGGFLMGYNTGKKKTIFLKKLNSYYCYAT
jgi:hypothetical protein